MPDHVSSVEMHAERLLRLLDQRVKSARGLPAGEAMSEADYKRLWHAELGAEDEALTQAGDPMRALSIALQGGALANGLAQVFIAGYQGAIRHVMPQLPGARWASLLVSEDQQDPQANPPTQLHHRDNGVEVQGTKSWVAASQQVDVLVVSAKTEAGGVEWFWCSAEEPGVALTHRSEASFLPDLSQGFARFEKLQLGKDRLLEPEPFSQFMYAESVYVGLALVGYLWRHWDQQEDLQDALVAKQEPARSFALSAAAGLADALALAPGPQAQLPLVLLQGWQLRLGALQEQFEQRWLDTSQTPAPGELAQSTWATRWWRDHRLTAMYAPMIRSRFAKQTMAHLGIEQST